MVNVSIGEELQRRSVRLGVVVSCRRRGIEFVSGLREPGS